MCSNYYSSVDPNNGNVSWEGQLSIKKGDHSHMPIRTDAYLPGDERGHVNASSLGGTNTTDNIVAQHYDVNHGAYYSMEQGERTALQNGVAIDSSKTAIVNANPGDRPEVFLVSDIVTYSNGHIESVHHSFTNASYTEQQAWNDQSAALPGAFDAPNPGDTLSSTMNSGEYAELMENTDAELPGIAEQYAAADFSGVPNVALVDSVSESTATEREILDTASETVVSADKDGGADCSLDD